MISIIIPAYNAAKTIEKCLASIFNQTYQDFEVIVVNDGSTDTTAHKLQATSASWRNKLQAIEQANQGANAARNRGWRETQKISPPLVGGVWGGGQYLLFCDADIVLRPDMLEKMVYALEQHPETSYAYSSFKFGWKTFKLWSFDAARLRQMPHIHTTSLIRREHFPDFDEKIQRLQDWDLWLTMLGQNHTGIWIPEVLFQIIHTKGTMSQWIPSFLHQMPWKWLGIHPKAILRYNEAVARIKTKHRL